MMELEPCSSRGHRSIGVRVLELTLRYQAVQGTCHNLEPIISPYGRTAKATVFSHCICHGDLVVHSFTFC